MRARNTRLVLYVNTVIYNDIMAEAEAMGFSPSEIANRIFLEAGYGKNTAVAALKPAKPSKPVTVKPPQWDDETEAEQFERFQVESRMNTDPHAIARVQARYEDHGLTEIVWREKPTMQK